MIKSEKGITIVALIATIVILLILTSTIMVNVNLSQNINKLNNMYADLKLLEEKVLLYYNKYGDIPKKDTSLDGENIESILGREKNINDSNIYYEIDSSKLESVTLNYGEGTGDNIYIINDRTLTIYYLKGIKYDGQVYHSYQYNYNELNSFMIIVKYHYLNNNDENQEESVSYTRGTAINDLYQPKKIGYTFGGWYDNAEFVGEEIVSLSADETKDKDIINLYGIWEQDIE